MNVAPGSVITGSQRLTVVECTCGLMYAIPESLHNQLDAKRERRSVYCPLGHQWHYVGKSDAEKVRELQDRLAAERAQHDQERATLKAQATRAKNAKARLEKRAAAGVCPCCNRTFQQLARHMKTKHPDYVEQVKR